MPLGDAIGGEPIIGAVVAEVVEPTQLHIGCFGVCMDIAQGVEGSLLVGIGKAAAVIALFPEVAAAIEHSVEAHRGIPV